MENYRMNYRNYPGQRSCNCDRVPMSPARPMPIPATPEVPACKDLALAMAYVPKQHYCDTFDLAKAFQVGTIFPELNKPFYGKGGGCR